MTATPQVKKLQALVPIVDDASAVVSTGDGKEAGSAAQDSGLLAAARDMQRLARLSSGAFAALFEYISRNKIYLCGGYTSRDDFAEKALGITCSALKKLVRAGRTAWAYYPTDCAALIAELGNRFTDVNLAAFPPLPNESQLATLPAALKKTITGGDREALLRDVRDGKFTTQDLARYGRVATAEPFTEDPTTTLAAMELPREIAGLLDATQLLEKALLRHVRGSLDDEELDLIQTRGQAILDAVVRLRQPPGCAVDVDGDVAEDQ